MYSSNIFGVGRLSPLTLDDVYQVVDTARNSVKNVVYASLSPPMFGESHVFTERRYSQCICELHALGQALIQSPRATRHCPLLGLRC